MSTKTVEAGWPAAKVEMWPLGRILPYERNPRTHPDAQLELLAQSMRDDGVTTPILVDEDGVVIAGHGRLQAAQFNEFARYPVVVARGWDEARKRAVRIKDNQIGLLSGWDGELMRLELQDLGMDGYDFALLGFDEDQLATFQSPGPDAPDQFGAVDENISTEWCCPRCSYRWSGNPMAGEQKEEA